MIGLLTGAIVGLIAGFIIVSNVPFVLAGALLGGLGGYGYGTTEDATIKREGRLL